ncbi:MAG: L-seryl-tRNA(Sec) selenium transferase [Actinomycetota bacterium]|nr:L-seryl-tRNA(Sec) selenium transferase [Actinomycetota bacterium]
MAKSSEEKRALLRLIPKIDELARVTAEMLVYAPQELLIDASRKVSEMVRNSILSGEDDFNADNLNMKNLSKMVAGHVEKTMKTSLRKVINATGVVLHTNLGRAPLSRSAMDAIFETSSGYSNLEYSLETGERGSRQEHLENIVCTLTGSEAAFVVNNNAAAVLIVLSTLAKEREVIISRGELVEIGDSFRLPDIMLQSGAKLIEVGTTNRTRISDYRNAINQETALIMKAHQSNYRIVGYSENVPLKELVKLGKQFYIPVVEDLGSGSIVDLSRFNLEGEPTPRNSIEAGADLVTFSGDKLLGGPQAGIIAGSSRYIEACKKHPLARAIRIDKMTVAALDATLREYIDSEEAIKNIPALKLLIEPAHIVRKKAMRLKRMLDRDNPTDFVYEVVAEFSKAGGGSLPLTEIPTYCLSVKHNRLSAQDLERRMRSFEPPIIVRIKDEYLLIDLRSVFDSEIPLIAKALLSSG